MKNLLFSFVFTLAILLHISPASSEGVEADLSTHHVAVKTDFAGVKVQLFGAIVNPGNINSLALLDMIIVVRGPKRQMRIRKKERVAGLWISAIPPILVGMLVGLLAAIMGVGGGFIMVPAMIYLLRMPTSVPIIPRKNT